MPVPEQKSVAWIMLRWPSIRGALDRRGSVTEDRAGRARTNERNAWRVSGAEADLVRQPAPAMPTGCRPNPRIASSISRARRWSSSTCRTAFVTRTGGWPGSASMSRRPAGRSRRWPACCQRCDRRRCRSSGSIGAIAQGLNLSPALLHVYNPTGSGHGLGDRVPRTGRRYWKGAARRPASSTSSPPRPPTSGSTIPHVRSGTHRSTASCAILA